MPVWLYTTLSFTVLYQAAMGESSVKLRHIQTSEGLDAGFQLSFTEFTR